MRTGITTGASAAAAAKAAAISLLTNRTPSETAVINPDGKTIKVSIRRYFDVLNGKGAVVLKDGGDDPDITHGLEIMAEVVLSTDSNIIILGGQGVGTVTKPGLQVPVGQPAINPVPQWMIETALKEALPDGQGCLVTISVPDGEKVARRTLNPRLGITGGISILGTTGIVLPMSEEAYKDSLVPLIDVAVAAGLKSVVLTPGRLGAKWAAAHGMPEKAVVEMSNFVGFMLEKCVDRGIEQVLLWGHHGKLIKIAAGIFHTHSKVADARQETYAALAAAHGAAKETVLAIMESLTTEAILEILIKNNLTEIISIAAERASSRAEQYVRGSLKIGTAFLAMNGKILAADQRARLIGGKLGWRI
ncbi:cobalt-precorrin 5B C1-methyltransferase [Desulfotomaculum arcticum]|uniref:Cobalt-precorrin-5B C(1)-methyltransferase n=1 Tax=Desulfotruncus arcticus DSM 17038 TaxID=1121424 RepID=A0A1I2RY04_9FIRM|nr:cobalt-precorrin-5B (C(1))-methyltransferase CbiD [Desulfotruncus arcticus]SFG44409.1 cobalt-precorrin 5B C1-methyltransferase [Desulfotomaculum arcticum] [Desulfotruncus arcticus DSM 17038]